jgi:DNA-binding NarL/FixJ family response regulator
MKRRKVRADFEAGELTIRIPVRVLVEEGTKTEEISGEKQLSVTELKVFEHLVEGKSNKEISTARGISVGTVKFHVSHILAKLRCKDRAEIMRKYS